MKVLFVSNLYPNSLEPSRGVFNSYQIRNLAKRCEVRVVAPIPWFPIQGRHTPKGQLPACETLDGIEVHHPRHFYLPKIARQFNTWFFAKGVAGTLRKIRREFPFDVIFTNWTHPDACAVAQLAQELQLPFVASVSGSDAHIYLTFRIRAGQILRMFAAAQAVTTRSQDLKNMLIAYGVTPQKIHVVYNGVDPQRFQSQPRPAARQQLGWDQQEHVLLYVGRLSPEKGADDLLRGLAHARQYYGNTSRLVVVGDGPQRAVLERLARQLGLADRVSWAGWKKPTEISVYFSAADLLCLPSQNEGVANVVLEAFSCGLPVVATAVGGIPEIMTKDTGVLAAPRQPESFAAALTRGIRRTWDPAALRAQASRFDWDANAEHVQTILQQAVAGYSAR